MFFPYGRVQIISVQPLESQWVEWEVRPPKGGGLWGLGAASPRNGSVWEPYGGGVSAASLPIATPSEDER